MSFWSTRPRGRNQRVSCVEVENDNNLPIWILNFLLSSCLEMFQSEDDTENAVVVHCFVLEKHFPLESRALVTPTLRFKHHEKLYKAKCDNSFFFLHVCQEHIDFGIYFIINHHAIINRKVAFHVPTQLLMNTHCFSLPHEWTEFKAFWKLGKIDGKFI